MMNAYYSMTWMGPKGYPEHANSGRCYFTGLLGMFRLHGENDVLFADGTSGDGFSFRWSPVWGAPAFNGGAGAFHEIWEYTPRALGYHGHWEQDHEGGFEEAFAKLRRSSSTAAFPCRSVCTTRCCCPTAPRARRG